MDFKKKINGLVSDLDESVDFIEDLDNKELDENMSIMRSIFKKNKVYMD